MTLRFGVFGTARGWLLALPDRSEIYPTRNEALAAAVKLANLTRWRGEDAEVVSQERSGGTLSVMAPPSRLALALRR